MKRLNTDLFADICVDGIDHRDCPDYVDAYIASASVARFGRLTLWLDRVIPSERRSKDPTTGITVISPRCVRLRRVLGPLLWREATEAELERLNEDSEYVYQAVQDRLY